MKSPGLLATAFLFRRLIKSIDSVSSQLERIADLQDKRLKMDAISRNFPIDALEDYEPTTPKERVRGRAEVSVQSEADLAEIDRMEQDYLAKHGRPPGDEEDLIDLLKKVGAGEEQEPR